MRLAALGSSSARRDERDSGERDDVEDAGLDVVRPSLGKRNVGWFARHKRLLGELVLMVAMDVLPAVAAVVPGLLIAHNFDGTPVSKFIAPVIGAVFYGELDVLARELGEIDVKNEPFIFDGL